MSEMFDNISSKYDLLNHTLSLGFDRIWRRRLVGVLNRELKQRSMRGGDKSAAILDVGCGTGDLTIALARKGWSVTGVDISRGMVDIARRKCAKKGIEASFKIASADSLPFDDGTYAAVTVSFGIRNFDHRPESLKEMFRVTAPSGCLMILEFGVPRWSIWRALYMFYFKHILPLLGGLISGNRSAYDYLPESVMEFPKYEEFCAELTAAGYTDVSYKSLMLGVAILYKAHKP